MRCAAICLIGLSFTCALTSSPAASTNAQRTDYSGLGLNTKQLRAVRSNEAKLDAQDRAEFEKLWAKAPEGMKASELPKSVWFALWKWSITMATVGECSKFLAHSDVENLRHSWDEAKGKNPYFDGLIQAGDEAFQEGDAAGNDEDAPDEQVCAVTLRSLEAGNDEAVAQLRADSESSANSK